MVATALSESGAAHALLLTLSELGGLLINMHLGPGNNHLSLLRRGACLGVCARAGRLNFLA